MRCSIADVAAFNRPVLDAGKVGRYRSEAIVFVAHHYAFRIRSSGCVRLHVLGYCGQRGWTRRRPYAAQAAHICRRLYESRSVASVGSSPLPLPWRMVVGHLFSGAAGNHATSTVVLPPRVALDIFVPALVDRHGLYARLCFVHCDASRSPAARKKQLSIDQLNPPALF